MVAGGHHKYGSRHRNKWVEQQVCTVGAGQGQRLLFASAVWHQAGMKSEEHGSTAKGILVMGNREICTSPPIQSNGAWLTKPLSSGYTVYKMNMHSLLTIQLVCNVSLLTTHVAHNPCNSCNNFTKKDTEYTKFPLIQNGIKIFRSD